MIQMLRFPLALMVVFLHAEPNIDGWTVEGMVYNQWHANTVGLIFSSISHVLVQTAVPLFFIISGFLFFRNLYSWDAPTWRRKMKSRAITILIPYIIWVCIFTVSHLLRHTPSDLSNWLSNHGGLIGIFWNSQNWIAGGTNILGQRIMMSGPFAYHLWFLRDLMIAFALTPIYYLILSCGRNGKIRIFSILVLCLLAVVYLLQIQNKFLGVNYSTVFFFGFGSFLSLNKLSLVHTLYRYRRPSWILFFILMLILTFMDGGRTQAGSLLMPVFILVGCVAVIDFAAWWIFSDRELSLSLKYENASFFLYIIHPFFLSIVWSMLTSLVSTFIDFNGFTISFVNSHPIISIVLFFIKVGLAVLISLLTYKTMKFIFPKTTALLCGR